MSNNPRLKRETITIDGTDYLVRQWTGLERAEFFKRSRDDAMLASIYIVQRCTINEDGSPRWKTEALAGGESTDILDPLTQKICELSGVKTEDGANAQGNS